MWNLTIIVMQMTQFMILMGKNYLETGLLLNLPKLLVPVAVEELEVAEPADMTEAATVDDMEVAETVDEDTDQIGREICRL